MYYDGSKTLTRKWVGYRQTKSIKLFIKDGINIITSEPFQVDDILMSITTENNLNSAEQWEVAGLIKALTKCNYDDYYRRQEKYGSYQKRGEI